MALEIGHHTITFGNASSLGRLSDTGSCVLLHRFSSNATAEDTDVQFRVWAIKSAVKRLPLYVQVGTTSSVHAAQQGVGARHWQCTLVTEFVCAGSNCVVLDGAELLLGLFAVVYVLQKLGATSLRLSGQPCTKLESTGLRSSQSCAKVADFHCLQLVLSPDACQLDPHAVLCGPPLALPGAAPLCTSSHPSWTHT
jgi:hypothetical protein